MKNVLFLLSLLAFFSPVLSLGQSSILAQKSKVLTAKQKQFEMLNRQVVMKKIQLQKLGFQLGRSFGKPEAIGIGIELDMARADLPLLEASQETLSAEIVLLQAEIKLQIDADNAQKPAR